MGSMLKFDSERRELVRERRNARIERKLERQQARERNHSQTAGVPSRSSATQVLAERELRSAVDRIVIDALDRHERIAPPATPPAASSSLPEMPEPDLELARTNTLPRSTSSSRRRSRPGGSSRSGAAARRAMWAISRDAARTSPRRARRDPDLALAACVAYAVIARLPRTALRSAQRARPTPQTRSDRPRAFWR